MPNQFDLIIRNVNGLGIKGKIDVGIKKGKITDIKPHITGSSGETITGEGRFIIPGFADLHTHLDQAYLGGTKRWGLRTMMEMVNATESVITKGWSQKEIMKRALRAIQEAVSRGTTAIRTHVAVSELTGLAGIDALVSLRDQLQSVIDIQVVAFHIGGFSVTEGGPRRSAQAFEQLPAAR